MIKHIVMWTLKDEAYGIGREELARKIKNDLESLKATIPVIRHIEVGVNQLPGDAACDLCLVSAFADWDDLETYRTHPDHQAVVAFVKDAVTARHVVDYVTEV
jgi:hypothetical protein